MPPKKLSLEATYNRARDDFFEKSCTECAYPNAKGELIMYRSWQMDHKAYEAMHQALGKYLNTLSLAAAAEQYFLLFSKVKRALTLLDSDRRLPTSTNNRRYNLMLMKCYFFNIILKFGFGFLDNFSNRILELNGIMLELAPVLVDYLEGHKAHLASLTGSDNALEIIAFSDACLNDFLSFTTYQKKYNFTCSVNLCNLRSTMYFFGEQLTTTYVAQNNMAAAITALDRYEKLLTFFKTKEAAAADRPAEEKYLSLKASVDSYFQQQAAAAEIQNAAAAAKAAANKLKNHRKKVNKSKARATVSSQDDVPETEVEADNTAANSVAFLESVPPDSVTAPEIIPTVSDDAPEEVKVDNKVADTAAAIVNDVTVPKSILPVVDTTLPPPVIETLMPFSQGEAVFTPATGVGIAATQSDSKEVALPPLIDVESKTATSQVTKRLSHRKKKALLVAPQNTATTPSEISAATLDTPLVVHDAVSVATIPTAIATPVSVLEITAPQPVFDSVVAAVAVDIELPECLAHLRNTRYSKVLAEIRKILLERKGGAYLYGSAHYKNNPEDLDILLTGATAQELQDLLELFKNSGAQFVADYYKKDTAFPCRVIKMCWHGVNIDFIASDITPQAHSQHLDFTVGAQYYDLRSQSLLRPHPNSQQDSIDKVLRMIDSNPAQRLQQDPSILLRAARLVAAEGFRLETNTQQAITTTPATVFHSHVPEACGRDADRRYRELSLLFAKGQAYNNIEVLRDWGLFNKLFDVTTVPPELVQFSTYLVDQVAIICDHYASLHIELAPSLLYYAVYWCAYIRNAAVDSQIIEPAVRLQRADVLPNDYLNRSLLHDIETFYLEQYPNLSHHTLFQTLSYLDSYLAKLPCTAVAAANRSQQPTVPAAVQPLIPEKLPRRLC